MKVSKADSPVRVYTLILAVCLANSNMYFWESLNQILYSLLYCDRSLGFKNTTSSYMWLLKELCTIKLIKPAKFSLLKKNTPSHIKFTTEKHAIAESKRDDTDTHKQCKTSPLSRLKLSTRLHSFSWPPGSSRSSPKPIISNMCQCIQQVWPVDCHKT